MTPRAYTGSIVGGCLALLLPVLVLNLMLLANDARHDKNRLASAWQQQTGGVTYAPPISSNRPFKILRLADRLAQVDTVVFGSSTMMGLTADAFPAPLQAYNFAQSGNPLPAVIGEARALLALPQAGLKLMVIPLDWALGFVQAGGEPPRVDLDPAAVPPPQSPAWPVLLREALSLPRLLTLAAVLGEAVRAEEPAAAARGLFFEAAGAPYRCADGLAARDYDLTFRGQCVGFRADGSATFADQKRISAGSAPAMLAQAASASSQYARALQAAPADALTGHLAALQREARARGVRLLFLMPPLLPQLDGRLAASAHSGGRLRAVKSALQQWAQREQALLVDAGPSEHFGCVATEFIDAHHALPACYRRIFSQLDARGLLPR